jgi:hypothetical protein
MESLQEKLNGWYDKLRTRQHKKREFATAQ